MAECALGRGTGAGELRLLQQPPADRKCRQRDANGHAIQNDRLWALRFGNDQGAGPSNWLFFTAGISDEAHGLFGFFTPADNSAPEANGDDQ